MGSQHGNLNQSLVLKSRMTYFIVGVHAGNCMVKKWGHEDLERSEVE